MVYTQPSICPGKRDAQIPLGFWHTNGSPNLGHTIGPYNNQPQQNKRICRIVDVTVPANYRVKLKENEKKYIVISWELKKNVEHETDDYTNCN